MPFYPPSVSWCKGILNKISSEMLRQKTNHTKIGVAFIMKIDSATRFPDEGIPKNIASGYI